MKTIFFCLLLSGIVLAQEINNLSDAVKYYSGKATEMLKNGGDPNVLVNNEPAICYLARVEGINSHYIMMDLIKYGANPNSISKEGYSVVALALANSHDVDAVTELIKKGANLNSPLKAGIFPPLIIAASLYCNNFKTDKYKGLIQLMMDHNADVNIQSSSKTTALMIATNANDLEMVKYFLSYKADVNLKDDNGETALIKAAGTGRTEISEVLLEHGADPNIIPNNKETAIMRAAKEGYINIVQMLLAKGAGVKVKNMYGETALKLAELGGHKEIVELLKKATNKK